MNLKNAAGVVLLSIAVVSCGGGGGSTPPPTGGGGTTPPPPPPPPPPAAITYTKFADLTGDQTFASTCAVLNLTNSPRAEDPFAFGSGVTFKFTAASERWDITGDTLVLDFNPNDLRPNLPPNTKIYVRQNVQNALQTYIFAPATFGQTTSEYTRFGQLDVLRFDNQKKRYNCIFGVPTVPNDALPTVQSLFKEANVAGVIYTSDASGNRLEYGVIGSTAQITHKPASNQLDIQLSFRGDLSPNTGGPGPNVEFGTYSAVIPFNGSQKSFSAPLLNQQASPVGKLEGQFFGPRGSELAVTLNANITGVDGRPVTISAAIAAGVPDPPR